MTSGGKHSVYRGDALETQCANLLLGRLGSELALIYHDTLQSPLPPGLKATVDRLNFVLGAGERGWPGGRETSSSPDESPWTSPKKER